jgi:hypothetical protein
VIPRDRAHTMSIGVAARFKLTLRQMDIIGEWAPIGAKRKLPAGIVTLDVPANDPTEQWAGFFTWENTAGWRWCMKTSKSKYRAAQDRARSYRTGSTISLSRPAARPKSGMDAPRRRHRGRGSRRHGQDDPGRLTRTRVTGAVADLRPIRKRRRTA